MSRENRLWLAVWFALTGWIMTATLVYGLFAHPHKSQGQHVNDLISVGFTVLDPEGQPVERFEE